MEEKGDKQPSPWEMRVRVAYHIAEALEHCNAENRKIYHDLNAYRVLLNECICCPCSDIAAIIVPALSVACAGPANEVDQPINVFDCATLQADKQPISVDQ
ncbi:probable serine/threonine-protein kinase [Tanacetum coccineum]